MGYIIHETYISFFLIENIEVKYTGVKKVLEKINECACMFVYIVDFMFQLFSLLLFFLINFYFFFTDFRQLFKQLEAVDSNIDVQIFMVREVINEAFRFKRKYLVKLLEDFEQTLLQGSRIPRIDPPTYSR